MGTYAWKILCSKILPAKSRARRRRPSAAGLPSQAEHRNLARGPRYSQRSYREVTLGCSSSRVLPGMSHSRSVMKILDTWLMTSSKSSNCRPGSWHQCTFGSSADKTKSTLYTEPGCKRYHIVYTWLFKIVEVVKPQHGVQNINMFLSAHFKYRNVPNTSTILDFRLIHVTVDGFLTYRITLLICKMFVTF